MLLLIFFRRCQLHLVRFEPFFNTCEYRVHNTWLSLHLPILVLFHLVVQLISCQLHKVAILFLLNNSQFSIFFVLSKFWGICFKSTLVRRRPNSSERVTNVYQTTYSNKYYFLLTKQTNYKVSEIKLVYESYKLQINVKYYMDYVCFRCTIYLYLLDRKIYIY